jgi:alpha-D-ribose 1-methylphosphonate 5-triphosphate diphosphatase
MASLHPARSMGRDNELGSLEPGKRADVIVVRKHRDIPLVHYTIADGTIVYAAQDIRR